MSHQLKYQECYRKRAHKAVINAMVLSPDGGRLVTGSDDCTVLVWSTQSGSILCRIKAHSPVVSLAWLTNSNGFLMGCENGMLASVGFFEVSGTDSQSLLSLCLANRRCSSMSKQPSSGLTTRRYAVYHQILMMLFRYLRRLRTLRSGSAQGKLICREVCSYNVVTISCYTNYAIQSKAGS